MYKNDNGVISNESHVTYAAMLIQHRKESPETNNVKSERVGTMFENEEDRDCCHNVFHIFFPLQENQFVDLNQEFHNHKSGKIG